MHQRFSTVTEPALLEEVLRELDGNRVAAARRLGLARATLRKLMRKYDIDASQNDDEAEVE